MPSYALHLREEEPKNRISCGAWLFHAETQSHGDTEQCRASVPLGLCASGLKTRALAARIAPKGARTRFLR